MEVPNMLYYKGLIKCGYKGNDEKKFMYSDSPFLFIDVRGEEKLKGTSYYNEQEIEVVTELTTFCLELFKSTLTFHKKDQRIPIQKFTKNSIYVITPYNA